ncbi:hypothetical protein [Bacillus sp. J33]|uniref:hypothetical protein n=1 Tax=Bacillus sp. J33 TaxID=935836 RepID=UPI00047D1D21|nr:hypothetical protein [Bacillus sp. J33]
MKRFYAAGAILVILFILPIVWWHLEDSKKVKVAILDKTVPSESYREHQGITWVLNHMKYENGSGNPIQAYTDYYGFKPQEKSKSYTIKDFPSDFSDYDIIYAADTYGVYEDDLPWLEKKREGSRSGKLYGGLEEGEWNAILDRLIQKKKSLFIAEFNTFASPTQTTVRESVADYLGIEWSGWTGRYFEELDPDKNKEIPQWILDEFQDGWKYSGEGFILVNDLDYQVVVLEQGKHINEGGINLSFTDTGKKRFGIEGNPEYKYWFDIVTPKSGSEVLANYQWDLTKQGKRLLEEKGIPSEFAAVLANQSGSAASYYFAGDFNDIEKVPSFYKMKGLDAAYRVGLKYSEEAFYWSAYVPMMKSILQDFSVSQGAHKSKADSLQYKARVNQDTFEVYKNDKWVSMPVKGVNIGMGKPGYFPGEAAITEEEYYRWFEMIGEMNANSIRVYTLHPPGFYRALKRFNDNHEEKLYVFHGVWINEENLEESMDAFEEKNLNEFQEEMKKMVDVVHGNKVVNPEPGHASGVYRADVSEYVIGWLIGIEWNPYMVENTNNIHEGMPDYAGKYFQTKGGQPFEVWLARQMDAMVEYEKEQYNWIRPLSFTNWVTTDILDHPSEPNDQEDLVSVDPNVIYAKADMKKAGQFASYHIYPYYPDFFNYEESYQQYKDHRGENNSYAAYLNDLHQAHRLPILVAEFGVPASRGMTHENPFGWNQGFLSEKQQGEIVSRLYEDIMAEELLGGMIFTWQDEWFKRTWNTMDYDNPDRRPFWSNSQTNEQQFGLLSFDRHKIRVDGKAEEWQSPPLYKGSHIRSMYADHDERYLYLRMDLDSKNKGYPMILLDVIPNQGNHFINGRDLPSFSNGVEFIINLDEKESRMMVDTYYDLFQFQYGHQLGMIKPKPPLPKKNSGNFSRIEYVLSRELFIPSQNRTIDFKSYETGKLQLGNGNPDSKEYDSLADYAVSKNGTVEIRIPWLLLQAKDPSQREFMGDIYSKGLEGNIKIDQISIGALYFDEQHNLIDSLPNVREGKLGIMKGYSWKKWEKPLSEERLKQSYKKIKELFGEY